MLARLGLKLLRWCEPMVLALNRDRGKPPTPAAPSCPSPSAATDSVLSRLLSRTLCRIVRRSTFGCVYGKYAGRCVAISSLGGRWPRKARILPAKVLVEGLFPPLVLGAGRLSLPPGFDDSSTRSGSRTPRPLSTLMELARFMFRRSLSCIAGSGLLGLKDGVGSTSSSESTVEDVFGTAKRGDRGLTG